MIVALTNVCATLLLKAIEWLKDRNLRVFAALCPSNLDNCPLNGYWKLDFEILWCVTYLYAE